MEYREFIGLIGRMRLAQKAYFKSRSAFDLSRAKALESLIDDAIRSYISPTLLVAAEKEGKTP